MAYNGISRGVRGTNTPNVLNQVPDIEKTLLILEPYQTPLLQHLWLQERQNKHVINAKGKFSWFEDELVPHQVMVTAEQSGGATITIRAADLSSLVNVFRAGDIVFIEGTDEMAYVSTFNEGVSIVLTNLAGGSLTTIPANTYMKIVAQRNSDYETTLPTAITTQEVEKYNYLNIFNETIASSGRYQASETFTDGLTHDEQLEKKLKELKLKLERNFWFSTVKGLTTSGAHNITVGEGFLGVIDTNITNYSGKLTEETLDAHLMQVFQKGSNHRMHFAGMQQVQDINSFLKSRYELNPNPTIKIYGAALSQYITPFGMIDIIWNPIFDGKFTNYGFTVDPTKLRMRYMANDKKGSRKLRVEENVETPGTDGTTTKVLMDVGIEIHNEECHGILKGGLVVTP